MEHRLPLGILFVATGIDAALAHRRSDADSNVEMTWPVFAGEYHEIYLALLKERLVRDGIELSEKGLNRQFRLHLHRGIAYLASPNTIRSIGDLVRLSTEFAG